MIVGSSHMFQFMSWNYTFNPWISVRHLMLTLDDEPPWLLRSRSKEYLVVTKIKLVDRLGDIIDLVVAAQFTRFDAAFVAYKLLGGKGK